MRVSLAVLAAGLLVLTSAATPPRVLPVVAANDNRTPAGTLRDGVLHLDLVVTMARWYPEDSGGSYTDVPVFAEVGKRPQIPGPLIRVPQGTELRITLRNDLPDSTLTLFGFESRPVTRPVTRPRDITVRPGETKAFQLRTDVAGTFLYAARSAAIPEEGRLETEQLAGALIVDAPGARTDERIWVMNIWSLPRPDGEPREALTINGKSWPHTERIEATVGDTVRWRVVNGSRRGHPMHLHGFYFRVDAHGNGLVDTTYTPEQQRTVVTENMRGRETMTMSWVPDEPGNWLFHCHLTFHVDAGARLDPPPPHHGAHALSLSDHMAGLILGIAVRPNAGFVREERVNPRRVALHVVRGTAPDSTRLAPIGVWRSEDGRAPAPRPVRVPGDLLILTRGEPTDVTVHNGLDEPTTIHWHGLELESYSDGVAGWSGHASTVAPAIAPADSFTARLRLRRAGTFMYHTHLNDVEQVTAGLYGPLIVLEPGQRWDPTHDFLFMGGLNGLPFTFPFVNGVAEEAPLELRSGETYRLRFFNILPAGVLRFQIHRDSVPSRWRPVAKDGFTLPATQALPAPAHVLLSNGETFDAEFTPSERGTFVLTAQRPAGQPVYRRLLVVR